MIFNTGGSNDSISAESVKYDKSNVAQALDTLADELTANNNRIYMDYKDGKYGYNTDPLRGADTFNPFSSGGLLEPVLLWTYPYPTNNYTIASLTIPVDLTKYKAVMLTAKYDYTGGTTPTVFNYFRKDGKEYPLSIVVLNTQCYWRPVTVTNTSVVLNQCRYGNSIDNYKCIPLKLYGLTQDIIESFT